MKLISLVFSFRNEEKNLKELVERVTKSLQKINNYRYELIFVNDSSEDNSEKILIDLQKSFPIKIINMTRNKGIAVAKGRYVGFIDADDLWSREKISKQITFMKKNNFQMSHTSYKIINEEGAILDIRKSRYFDNYKNILTSCDIGLSSVLLKKELITDDIKFASLKTKEDFVLWLKILKSGFEIGALEEPLMSWRKTKGSLSSSIFQKLKDGFKVYNHYMNYNLIKSLYLLISLSINYLKKS